MKEVVFTRRFERDFRRLKKTFPRGKLDYNTLEYVFLFLQSGKPLPEEFREHPLTGEYAGFLECHVDADWLLVYRVKRDRVVFHREVSAALSPRKLLPLSPKASGCQALSAPARLPSGGCAWRA